MLYWLLHILLSNFSTFLNSLQLSQISIHLSVICFKSPSMSIYLINNLSLTSSDLIIPVFTDIDLRSTHPQSSICLIYWVQPIVNCCHRILHHPVTAIAQTSNEQIIVIQQKNNSFGIFISDFKNHLISLSFLSSLI